MQGWTATIVNGVTRKRNKIWKTGLKVIQVVTQRKAKHSASTEFHHLAIRGKKQECWQKKLQPTTPTNEPTKWIRVKISVSSDEYVPKHTVIPTASVVYATYPSST